ncbi:DUF2510 domain-containing protein [Lentzea sp. NPDC058450]|uniref:DUF2510 domain-containing protein n=1 Tax=Lentzea sp. NPDC058450 TaxID=3346505 RepID=UPI00364917D5
MTYPPVPAPARLAAWLPDPLDDALVRYWDGQRWTFHTAVRQIAPVAAQPSPAVQPPQPALRPDVAAAVDRVRGLLVGSMKEINLLGDHLSSEERVLALTGAAGEGQGVLVCTNQRLLFLFVGLIRKQFLHVGWNQAKAVVYDRASRMFSVYVTKPTKRAVPAFSVRVANLGDAQMVVQAAQSASTAPRLDIV